MKGKLTSRKTEGHSLDLEPKRGITADLRKLFEESLSTFPIITKQSPDGTDFLHKIEEVVQSKVIMPSHGVREGGASRSLDERNELKLAQKIKERIDNDTEKVQSLSPVSQSKQLIKIAQELLAEMKDPASFLSNERSKTPDKLWEKLSNGNTKAEAGWLLSKEELNARPVLIGGKISSDFAQNKPKTQLLKLKSSSTSGPETPKTTINTTKDPVISPFDPPSEVINKKQSMLAKGSKDNNRKDREEQMTGSQKQNFQAENKSNGVDQAKLEPANNSTLKQSKKTQQRGRENDLRSQALSNLGKNFENVSENSNHSGSRDNSSGSSKHDQQQPFQDKTNPPRSQNPMREDLKIEIPDQKVVIINSPSGRKFEFNPEDSPLFQARSQTEELLIFTDRSHPGNIPNNAFGKGESLGSFPQHIEEEKNWPLCKKDLLGSHGEIDPMHRSGYLIHNMQDLNDEFIIPPNEFKQQISSPGISTGKNGQGNRNEFDFQNLVSDDESLAETLIFMGNGQSGKQRKNSLELAKSAQRIEGIQQKGDLKSHNSLNTSPKISENQNESPTGKRLTPMKEIQVFSPQHSDNNKLNGSKERGNRQNNYFTLGPKQTVGLNQIKTVDGSVRDQINERNAGANLSSESIEKDGKLIINADAFADQNLIQNENQTEIQSPVTQQSRLQKETARFMDHPNRGTESDTSEIKINRDGLVKPCLTAEDTVPTETDLNIRPIQTAKDQEQNGSKNVPKKAQEKATSSEVSKKSQPSYELVASTPDKQSKGDEAKAASQNHAPKRNSNITTKESSPSGSVYKLITPEKKTRSLTGERCPEKSKEKEQAILAIPSCTKNSKLRTEMSPEKGANPKLQQTNFSIPIQKLKQQVLSKRIEGSQSSRTDNRSKSNDKQAKVLGRGVQSPKNFVIPFNKIDSGNPGQSDSQVSTARSNVASTKITGRTEGIQQAISELEEVKHLKVPSKRDHEEYIINDSFNLSRQPSNPKIPLFNSMFKQDSSNKSPGLEATPKFTFLENWHASPSNRSKTPTKIPPQFVIKEVVDPAENKMSNKPTPYKTYGFVENKQPENSLKTLASALSPAHRKSKSQPKLGSATSRKELPNPFTYPANSKSQNKIVSDYKIESKYVIEGPKLPSSTKNNPENSDDGRICSPEKSQQNKEDDQTLKKQVEQQRKVSILQAKFVPIGSVDNLNNISDISVKKFSSISKLEGRGSIGEILSLNQDSELEKLHKLKNEMISESIFDLNKQKDRPQTWNGVPLKRGSTKKPLEFTVQNPTIYEELSTCKEQAEEEENNFDDLKLYTKFLRKGVWNYANSPRVQEMTKKKAQREARLLIDQATPYPVHQPCSTTEEEHGRISTHGYSPKMYQNVFGDMSQDLNKPPQTQLSQLGLPHSFHPYASLFRVGAPSRRAKTMNFDEIKERVALKKNIK